MLWIPQGTHSKFATQGCSSSSIWCGHTYPACCWLSDLAKGVLLSEDILPRRRCFPDRLCGFARFLNVYLGRRSRVSQSGAFLLCRVYGWGLSACSVWQVRNQSGTTCVQSCWVPYINYQVWCLYGGSFVCGYTRFCWTFDQAAWGRSWVRMVCEPYRREIAEKGPLDPSPAHCILLDQRWATFSRAIVDVREAFIHHREVVIEIFEEFALIDQLGMLAVHWFEFDCHLEVCFSVDCLVDLTKWPFVYFA